MTTGRSHARTGIAFATSRSLPEGFPDDALAAEACRGRGLNVSTVIWDAQDVSWDAFSAVVVRSTWDYSTKIDRFLDWIDGLEDAGVPVFNDPEILRWNVDKSYLLELSESGVPVVPTLRLEGLTEADLEGAADELGTPEVVVKPVVGAGGRNTFRVGLDRPGEIHRVQRAWSEEPMLAQPYLPEILSRGEWSLIYLDGSYSHAILKTPAEGEFRVHEEWGGTIRAASPTPALRRVADGAMAVLGSDPLYGRVDLVESESGPLLMELELLEPALYFEQGPGSAERFADALAAALEQAEVSTGK